MFKKIISVVLVICVLSSMIVFADAQSNKQTPNKKLLESLLDSRSWVLDILVEGDHSTNPYIVGVDDFENYSEAAYQRFVNNGVNKTLVRLVDILYNGTDYISDGLRYLTSEQIEELRGHYGIVIPENKIEDMDYLFQVLGNSLHSVFGKTREEKYYDYLLSGMFTTTYTTHSQMSIEEEEVKFSELQTYIDEIDSLDEVIDKAKEWASAGSDLAEYTKATKVKDLFTGYSYSIGTYLDLSTDEKILETVGISDDVMNKKLSFTDTVYNLTMYQRSCDTDEDIEKWRKEVQSDKLIKKTNKVLKTAGQVVDFANSALENYVLIESLQHQKDTTLGSLKTLYNTSGNKRLKSALAEYISLMTKEFDDKTFLYKTALDTLEKSDLIYDAASDFVTKKIGGFIVDRMSFSTAKLASKAVSLAAAVNITTLLGDKVTGVEETAKKVYQIEHMLKMIDEMVDAYNFDLAEYKADKTDEKAKKVLDDLLLLKKMRLFVTKLTYDSAKNQLNTPLGKLMCGGDDIVSMWDDIYQQQVDIILSATLNPVSSVPFQVRSGEKLYVYTKDNYAYYQKNEKLYTIGEISQRLLAGLNVNGGEVYFLGGTSTDDSFYLSSITSTGDSKVKVGPNTSVALYALSQENGSLTFELTGNIEIHKDIDLRQTNINITGNGEFICKGNLIASSTRVEGKIVMASDKKQTLSASSFTVKGLVFRNTAAQGVDIKGTVNVTGLIENVGSVITNGKNIVLKQNGDISGNYYKGDITLETYTYNRDIIFDGNVYVSYSMAINASQALIKGSLIGAGAVTVNSSASSLLKIMGDLGLYGSTINIGSAFEIGGDIELVGSTINVDKIILVGKSAQKLKTDTTVSLKHLVNRNTSRKGVDVQGVWKITESIYAPEAKFSSGKNLVLTSQVKIDGGILNSSVTAQNWESNGNFTINGTVYATGDITFADGSNVRIKDDISHSEGKITISKNSRVSLGSDYAATGGSILIDGTLDVESDVIMQNNTISGQGELITGGDFVAHATSGMCSNFKMHSLLPQSFYSDKSTELQNLTVDNPSVGGISVDSEIIVYNQFTNNAFRIIKGENIVCRAVVDDSQDMKVVRGNLSVSTYECDTDLHIMGNLTVGTSLVIPENISVFVDGNVNAESGSIVIGNGAKLETTGSLSSSASIILGDNAQLTVAKKMESSYDISAGTDSLVSVGENLFLYRGNHCFNGAVQVNGDIVMCSSTVGGTGYFELSGDLTGGTVTGISLRMKGKTPQFLESNGKHTFTDITVENTSASGVIPVGNVYYTGTFDTGGSNIKRPELVISKKEG